MKNRMLSEIREIAGARGKPWKIEIVPGGSKPRLCGEKWHYTNKSGDIIYHPSAYCRKGRRSMIYQHSTKKIEVGKNWWTERGGNRIFGNLAD